MALSPELGSAASLCPCGSGCGYPDCCGRYHSGNSLPETAEQLMRSRYSAYVLKLADYLYQTTHPDKRTSALRDEIAAWAAQVEFYHLDILAVQRGQAADKIGKVEFIAHYRRQQQTKQLREVSRFRRYQGGWCYYDGEIG